MESPTQPLLLRADPEHGGLRTAVLILLFLIILLLYFAISIAWPEAAFLLSCGLSLLFGFALAYGIELLLKKYWPSGRALLLDVLTIQTQDNECENVTIPWANEPELQSWWFYLKGFQRGGRERRVPKNWVCVATQLQTTDERIIAYTFLSPQKMARWIDNKKQFHQIIPAHVYKSSLGLRVNPPSRPEIPAQVLAGEDGKYWLAERRRWENGFELTPQDFAIFMNFVETQS